MPSRFGRGLRATAALAAVAACVVLLRRLLESKGLAWASEFAGIAGFLLALATFTGPWLARQVRGPRPVSTSRIADAVEDLAGFLGRQWAEEERLRRVNDPRPLPVRWEVTPAAAAAMPGEGPGQPGHAIGPAPSSSLAGEFDDILATFQKVPGHRLVIIGPAGAGKSMLVTKLARDLLEARAPGMPVPVIVAAAAWDAQKGVTGWIADQLVRNHPGLDVKVKAATGDKSRLADFMAGTNILPILDGLDELPDEPRERALAEINAYGSDKPIVVTSRPEEYLGAVTTTGRAISRATVADLRPLEIPQVKAYLSEATAALPANRWAAVFARLDADPAGPLAAALATPLMVWLARTIYEAADSDPGELADEERFSDQETIELHLLDAFLPAVYAPGMGSSRHSWRPDQARRWLAFLAARIDRTQRQDVEWWRLDRVVIGLRPVTFAIRAAVLAGVTLWLAGWLLRRSDWRYAAHAPLADLDELLRAGPAGRHVLPAINYIAGPLIAAAPSWMRLRATLHANSLALWHPLPSVRQLVLWAALLAAAIGVLSVVFEGWEFYWPAALKTDIPAAGRRAVVSVIRWVIFVLALVVAGRALGSGSLTAGVASFVRMPSARLLLSLGALLGLAEAVVPASRARDMSRPASPVRTLHLDRQADILPRFAYRVAGGTMAWLYFGPDVALLYGACSSVSLLGIPLIGSVHSASGRFTDARIWLACGRRMPLRSMTFLADAHRRGVLRRAGAAYQFRHIRLQQRLSAQHPRWSRRLAAMAVPLIRRLEPYTSYNPLMPVSTAPWAEPIGALIFEEAAAQFAQVSSLGGPAGDLRRIGPGFAQNFEGAQHRWVMCARPGSVPLLVARPVWDAIRKAAPGTLAEVYTALGYPTAVLADGSAEQRVIPPDVDRVKLAGGKWGQGVLVRGPTGDHWHWEAAESVYSPGRWDDAAADVPGLPQAWFRATANIPWAVPGLRITAGAHEMLLDRLPSSDLTHAVAGLSARRGAELPPAPWQPSATGYPPDRSGATCTVAGPAGRTALAAEVSMSLRHDADAVTLTTSAELRIEGLDAWGAALCAAGGPRLADREMRVSLVELRAVLSAAWSVAAEMLPGVLAGDPVTVPPAGSPSFELALSARAPQDSPAGHQGIRYYVDLSPFVSDAVPPRWSGSSDLEPATMRVEMTGPLRLGRNDRISRTGEALVLMVQRYGFHLAPEDGPPTAPDDSSPVTG